MSYTFTFNTRETYLAYKAEWKARYFAHFAKIRESALVLKAAQQEYGKYGYAYRLSHTDYGQLSAEFKNKWGAAERALIVARANHAALKKHVQQLLTERYESREEAARQWCAQQHKETT